MPFERRVQRLEVHVLPEVVVALPPVLVPIRLTPDSLVKYLASGPEPDTNNVYKANMTIPVIKTPHLGLNDLALILVTLCGLLALAFSFFISICILSNMYISDTHGHRLTSRIGW